MSERLRGTFTEVDFLLTLVDRDATREQREGNAQKHMPAMIDFLAAPNVLVVSTALDVLGFLANESPSIQLAALDANVMDSIVRLLCTSTDDFEPVDFNAFLNYPLWLSQINLGQINADDESLWVIQQWLSGDDSSPWIILMKCKALFALAMITHSCEQAEVTMLESGALRYVVELLSAKHTKLVTAASWALCRIIGPSVALRAAAFEGGAIPALVGLLGWHFPEIQKSCLLAMQFVMLCVEDGQVAAFEAGAIPRLVELFSATDDVSLPAAQAFSCITHHSPAARRASFEAGAIPALVNLLNSSDVVLQASAIPGLRNIMSSLEDARVAAFEAGVIPHLVKFLPATDVLRQALPAAQAFACITRHPPACRASLEAGAIPALVDLLNSPDVHLHSFTLSVLTNIMSLEDARVAVFEAGAIPRLVEFLSGTDVLSAAEVINWITVHPPACTASFEAGAIPALVNLLSSSDTNLQSSTLSALRNITTFLKDARVAAFEAGAIPRLVEFLSATDVVSVPAAQAINWITAHPPASRASFEAGATLALVNLLDSSQVRLHAPAVGALGNIMLSVEDARVVAFEAGAIPRLVKFLTSTDNLPIFAALAIRFITLHSPACIAFFEAGAVPALVDLLNSSDNSLITFTVAALEDIMTSVEDARLAAVKAGAIPYLIKLMSDNGPQNRAPRALMNITHCTPACSLAYEAGAIPVLVRLLYSSNVHILSWALGTLANIVASVEDARAAAFESGLIPPLIVFLSIPNPKLQIPASGVMLDITRHPLGCAGVHQAGAIPVLERLLNSPYIALRHNASNALANIRVTLLRTV